MQAKPMIVAGLLTVIGISAQNTQGLAQRSESTDGIDSKVGRPSSRFGQSARHPVPREHPRLLGSRQRLVQMARERADAYQRVKRVAQRQKASAIGGMSARTARPTIKLPDQKNVAKTNNK